MNEVLKSVISVIVPVYNAEKYLKRTVESVLAQSYADFELILADDCSSDGSGDICESFAARDSRVKYLRREENGGQAAARNTGLDAAAGGWIFFLDSDDYLEPDALSVLISLAEGKDADIVVGGYREVDESGNLLRVIKAPNEIYTGKEALGHRLKHTRPLSEHKEIFTHVCMKLFKRSLVGEERFPRRRQWTVISFLTAMYAKAGKIAAGEIVYNYLIREGSLSKGPQEPDDKIDAAYETVMACLKYDCVIPETAYWTQAAWWLMEKRLPWLYDMRGLYAEKAARRRKQLRDIMPAVRKTRIHENMPPVLDRLAIWLSLNLPGFWKFVFVRFLKKRVGRGGEDAN